MMNQQHIFDTLQNRINTIKTLYQNIEKHAYLVPELFIKTIRDTHRYLHDGISYSNAIEIIEELGIVCSAEELTLLTDLETSLRKAKDYQELSERYNREMLFQIVKKFDIKLNELG